MAKHIFRFLGEPVSESIWRISNGEHYHLRKVLRLEMGCQIEVMDGKGRWVSGIVENIGKDQTSLISKEVFFEGPQNKRLSLCLAGPKPRSVDEVLPSLVELGVDHLIILQSKSGGPHTIEEKNYTRWKKIIIESVKQCKRAWIPGLSIYKCLGEYTSSPFYTSSSNKFYCDHEGAESLLTTRFDCNDTIVVIGNEQGLDDETVEELKANEFREVKLTPYILRAGTAAIAATTIAAVRRDSLE